MKDETSRRMRISNIYPPRPPPPPFLQELLGSPIEQLLERCSDDRYPPRTSSRFRASKISSRPRTNSSVSTISASSMEDSLTPTSLLCSFLFDLFDEKGVGNPKEDVTLILDNFERPYHNMAGVASTLDVSQSIHYSRESSAATTLASRCILLQDEQHQQESGGGKDDAPTSSSETQTKTLQKEDALSHLYEVEEADNDQDQGDALAEAASSCWQDSCRSIEPLSSKGSDLFVASNNGKSPTSIMDLLGLGEIPEPLEGG